MDHIQPANVANYLANEDWWFYLPAILFVDTVVIFLARIFPDTVGLHLNVWYDKFGLAAVLADTGIIAITIAIARYLYSYLFMEKEGWSIWYFIALAAVIQLVHDLAFSYGVIQKIPQGHNDMIDIFKTYINRGPIILLADAVMVAGSIGIASLLKGQDYHYTTSGFFVTAYALSYILYTNVK
jgi:hypothetical protein